MSVPRCSAVMVLATACVALVSLATIDIGVIGSNHWVVTDYAGIVPKVDYPFRPNSAKTPHLIDFLHHSTLLKEFRARMNMIEAVMFGAVDSPVDFNVIPDLLSNVDDFRRNVSGNELTPLPPSSMLPIHKDINIQDHVDLNVHIDEEDIEQPFCTTPQAFSMSLYLHLPSVSLEHIDLPDVAEPTLGNTAWLLATNARGEARSQRHMGTLITQSMASNQSSWVLYNLATMYWRIEGNAREAMKCVLGALQLSPLMMRDLALLQLANMLYVRKAYSEALVLIESALTINDANYPVHYLHGTTTLALGDAVTAQHAFETAIMIQPELRAAFDINKVLSSVMKEVAMGPRRERIIRNTRLTRVLAKNKTWDDERFMLGYLVPNDTCVGVTCVENAMCIPQVHPICVCKPSWTRSKLDKDSCVEDQQCKSVRCKIQHQACYDGECRCHLGFVLRNNECVPDLCTRVECVTTAQCNSATGRCSCSNNRVQHGASCIDAECVGIECSPTHMCVGGKCVCEKGMHAQGDECVEDEACVSSTCPANSHCNVSDGHCRCNAGFVTKSDVNKCVTAKDLMHLESQKTIAADKDIAPLFWKSAGCKDSMRDRIDYTKLTTAIAMFPKSWDAKNKTQVQAFWSKSKKSVKTYKAPTCKPNKITHDFSYAALDHIEGIALRSSKDIHNAFTPQTKFLSILQKLMGNTTLSQREMGHLIAVALKKKQQKNPFVYNVATLWWMVEGNPEEALNCVRLSLMFSTLNDQITPLINAANILMRVRRPEDALVLAQIAMDINKDIDLVHHSLAVAMVGVNRNERAIQLLQKQQNVEGKPKGSLLQHLECYQLHKLMLQTYFINSKPHREKLDLLNENIDAQQLYIKLLQDRISLSILADEEIDTIWSEMAESKKSLILLTERQLEQERLVKAIAAVTLMMSTQSKDQSSSRKGARKNIGKVRSERKSSTKKTGSKDTIKRGSRSQNDNVVVLPYPKAPSIPALISAVEDMLDGEMSISSSMPFDDTSWPSADDCARVDLDDVTTLLQFPVEMPQLFVGEKLDKSTTLLLHTPADKDKSTWGEPHCGAIDNPRQAHTLEHLEGVAQRSKLTMIPQTKLESLLKSTFGLGSSPADTDLPDMTKISLSEAGEHVRFALEKNKNSWYLLEMAALYWQIVGNPKEAIECLQKSYHGADERKNSQDKRKDKSLISMASVLHQTGQTFDGMTLAQMAIQVHPKKTLSHFTLGNLLVSFGTRGYEEAAFFFETAFRLDKNNAAALERLLVIRCHQASGI
eukprot:m.197725 g.197725  ORF g.197725 m.197725 type:complete len:1273 (+) comp32666_c0_seq3:330-4148(+)